VKPGFHYSVGDIVRIRTGAFQNFTGRIEAVDEEKATVEITVDIFGRTEPIELRFVDIEQITFTEEE
jgi:transcription termination/antitermination protein NusG